MVIWTFLSFCIIHLFQAEECCQWISSLYREKITNWKNLRESRESNPGNFGCLGALHNDSRGLHALKWNINRENMALQPLSHYSPSYLKRHLSEFWVCICWEDNLAKLNSIWIIQLSWWTEVKCRWCLQYGTGCFYCLFIISNRHLFVAQSYTINTAEIL